mmetsp:Transcript_14704/g.21175  ORF Transcript_14704/g.21175 Transcript_14704/m.21175 type:complete len:122 (+) Transcript_14704:818-1183(+)
MDPNMLAKQFTEHYYGTFDTSPQNLSGLFTQNSMMTFEGQQFQGVQNILQKITQIGRTGHEVKTVDVQPSVTENALIIFVTGMITIDGGNKLHFCELFQLVATAPQQYVIHNDVFRLNYGS